MGRHSVVHVHVCCNSIMIYYSAAPNVLRVMKLLGDKDERAAQTKRIKSGDFDVVVASFESCLKEQSTLKKIQWKYVVIDEAHRIKNENSSLSVVVRIDITYRICVSHHNQLYVARFDYSILITDY